ncbi:MAG: hypothetical protein Q8P81_00700 [Nanoarchaeota archaeon]|nr:hypothetical protein [Nanoarchaeota archaeon]
MVVASKKKSVKRKDVKKKASSKKSAHSNKGHSEDLKIDSRNKVLVENFVGLQKVMVDLASKFDDLSTNISKLLDLFESSAKHLARKDFDSEKMNKDSEKILEKLDSLSEKAGLIGKGLVLIHEAGSGSNRRSDFEGMEQSRHIFSESGISSHGASHKENKVSVDSGKSGIGSVQHQEVPEDFPIDGEVSPESGSKVREIEG